MPKDKTIYEKFEQSANRQDNMLKEWTTCESFEDMLDRWSIC